VELHSSALFGGVGVDVLDSDLLGDVSDDIDDSVKIVNADLGEEVFVENLKHFGIEFSSNLGVFLR
jgi:hypothetical protein